MIEENIVFGTQKKQKYSFFSNICCHLRAEREWDRKLFTCQWAMLLPMILGTFLGTLLPAEVVRGLQEGWPLEQLALWILLIGRPGVGKELNDSGVTFSGGEKQKIAIARAIYKNALFVIMDEPTAALDPEAECEVYAGFDRMVGRKTALYISHRLASCRFCRDILVFDQGRVVQRGSHEELEKQEGLYRELWNAQAQYYA